MYTIPPLTNQYIIGGPAEIQQLKSAFTQNPVIPGASIVGQFHGITLTVSNFVDPGYAYMLQNGKVVAVIDLGGGKMFMDKWQRDGEALKQIIAGLHNYLAGE